MCVCLARYLEKSDMLAGDEMPNVIQINEFQSHKFCAAIRNRNCMKFLPIVDKEMKDRV